MKKELKLKEEQLLVMKMNNDKITSLYEQKSKFLESEVTSWKNKYHDALVENKNIETELNKENSKLKEKNNNLIKLEQQKKLEENKSKINKPNHSFSKSNPFMNNEYIQGYNKIIKIENIIDKTYISRNNININRSYKNNNNELSSKTNN